jgi:hypothetical protein
VVDVGNDREVANVLHTRGMRSPQHALRQQKSQRNSLASSRGTAQMRARLRLLRRMPYFSRPAADAALSTL